MVTSNQGEADIGPSSVEQGVQAHWLPVSYSNHMTNSRRIRAFCSFAYAAARTASKLRPDVVLASSTPLTVALPGYFAAQRNRAPMVFEVRDLWPETPIALGALGNPLLQFAAHRLEDFAYRNSAHIIALSPAMKDGIVTRGIASGRITVIPNSCDFDAFHIDNSLGRAFRDSHHWLGNRPLVVYAGTFGKVNGVGFIVRLAEVCLELAPDVRFLLVGSGREEAEVRALAEKVGVLNVNLFFMSEVAKSQIPSVLSAASLTMSTVIDVPALWKNSANKFFDSLAASRPIAINHEGWLADLIRSEDVGLVLHPSDYRQAARQLIAGLRDDRWLHAAGERAFQVGSEKFDRDRLAKKVNEVLCKVVNEQ